MGKGRQIFVANPKGGSGKTTVATQLASYFAQQGMAVALVDHDVQRSSFDWLRQRPASLAPIVPVAHFRGQKVNADAVDWVIHDLPAAMSSEALMARVDGPSVLLVPIQPSPTDIAAGVRFLMSLNCEPIIEQSVLKVGLLANRVRANTHYFKVLSSILGQLKMPLLTSIRDTQNYTRAMGNGISIFELPPSRVAMDLQSWVPLCTWLELQFR